MFLSDSSTFINHGTSRQFGKHLLLNGLFLPYSILQSRRLIAASEFERLVFVCHGNVCRSPYAEHKAQQMGIKSISFGLDTRSGTAANGTAISVATDRGVDLSSHRSQQISVDQLKENDLILAMEPWHIRAIKRLEPSGHRSVALLGLAASQWPYSYIPDPYGLSDTMFGSCFDIIDRALETLSTKSLSG